MSEYRVRYVASEKQYKVTAESPRLAYKSFIEKIEIVKEDAVEVWNGTNWVKFEGHTAISNADSAGTQGKSFIKAEDFITESNSPVDIFDPNKAMTKTFKRVFKIIGYLMLGSFIILFISEPSDIVYQLWFLCLSIYIPFYIYYAEKEGKILTLHYSWNTNFKENPEVFRLHQLFYMIFAISIFTIIVTQLTAG